MRRVQIEAAAKAELAAAIEWYEEQSPGLGAELHAAVDEVMERLKTPPDGGTSVPNVAAELGVRRIFTKRFPYGVIYVVRDDTVSVIAVAHLRRRPGYWQDRTQ